MKRSKPVWRILSTVIVAALLLNAQVYLPVKSSAAAAGVIPRISIEYADSTFRAGLASPPQDLIHAAGVVDPRIIIQYADSTFHTGLASPPRDLVYAAGMVTPRIIIQYADSTFHQNLAQLPIPQFAITAIDEARGTIAAGIGEGLDMAEAETLLSRAEGGLAAGDYAQAISLARQAETAAEVIKADAEAALEEIAAVRGAIDAGTVEGRDMAKAQTLLVQAKGALAAGDFGGAISLAQQAEATAEEIKRDAQAATEEIAAARGVIVAGSAEGLDMAEAESLLRQAEMALARGDFRRAKTLAQQAETKVEGIRRAAALQQINQAKDAIATGRAEGLDMSGAEALLAQAQDTFQRGAHRRAGSLALQAEVTAQEVKREAQAAFDAIDQARGAIEEDVTKHLDMTPAEGRLRQAELAFQVGDHRRALSLARKAKAKAEEISRELRLVKSSIEEVRQVISEERARGFNVVEAESSLSQAESAFDDRKFQRAVDLAATAKSLALDIDQDGVLNYKDFAPTINNYHIYGAAFLLALGLVSVAASVSFRRWRKKAAKREIEKKKRVILRMIDGLVNEGRRN